jgi:hypothetical protein
LVLAFAAVLLAQFLVREYYMEAYPMIVLPAGAGLYEHKADSITTYGWKATAYTRGNDSARVDESALFPGNPPPPYQRRMYSTLMEMRTKSRQSVDMAAWIQKNIAGSTPLPQIDSFCVHRIEKTIPLEEGEKGIRYKRRSCYNLSADR